MNLSENGGTRVHHLELAFKYLMFIPPTSYRVKMLEKKIFSSSPYVK